MAELDYPISQIWGLAEAQATALKGAGCGTTAALLDACATRRQRDALAATSGIDGADVLVLANRADLMRIGGIGTKWGALLELAGVDTVKELATRNAANLLAKLEEVNAEHAVVQALPNLADCTAWIDEAKTLPRRLSY